MQQIKLIADVSSVKGRLEKDKHILSVYENLIKHLKIDILALEQTDHSLEDDITLCRFSEELLRHEESFKSKQFAVDYLQQRADEWEVQFEENSRIVNETFEKALQEARSKYNTPNGVSVILKELIDGYDKNPQDVLSDQQTKNNLYYQIVDQLNSKK